jgi:cobalt-zinc-cadmium efflux system outer membrane protein
VTLCKFVLLSLLLPGPVFLARSGAQNVLPVVNPTEQASTQVSEEAENALPVAPAPQSSENVSTADSIGQGQTLTLSLADAIAMAQRNSPRLHEASAVTERRTAAVRTARAYSNPSIEVFEGHQYARSIPTPGVPGLLQHYAVSQAIEIPAERRARQHIARLEVTSATQGQRATGLSVVADVKHAFYNALRRREEIGYANENLQLVQDLRRRVEVEVRVGEKGRLELTRAEAELARARFILRSAQLEYANAIALLRVTIAASPDMNLDPEGTLEPRLSLPLLKELREHVLRTHPAVAQSQTDVQAASADLDRARALRIPQPTAFAEYENQPDQRFWRAGLTVSIPLWDHRQGPIGEAKAAASQASAVLDQRRLELISALERAYEQYQLADQQATSLESGSMHAAESAVDASKNAYRFGERGIVEVLDAQRVLQSVRSDLVNAQFARQSALVDLEELGAVAPGVKP